MSDRPLVCVTGAAGFIGSHLAERLLAEGYPVLGIDCFTDFYARAAKERNLAAARAQPAFRFVEGDLLALDLAALLREVEVVYHQAAQAGVRGSWGPQFATYLRNNVQATQRLLEAARAGMPRLRRIVYASSSSVYGTCPDLPLGEASRPEPFSPYGVTKLAGEHLCRLYHRNDGLPVVSLRYFTVYGPRQRPDMAFHRFCRAILRGEPLEIFGDGEQTRDFTFVADAVEANLLALGPGLDGEVFNVGGGAQATVNEALRILGEMSGRPAPVRHLPAQRGDMRHTCAETRAARQRLGFSPRVGLREGLARELEWVSANLDDPGN
jgi:nucleoside-diphosphate-sugar epimerase